MISPKLGPPFEFYMKLNDKQDWKDYLKEIIIIFQSKRQTLPSKITLNPKEFTLFLGKKKGISLAGTKIIVIPDKTCIAKHAKLFL